MTAGMLDWPVAAGALLRGYSIEVVGRHDSVVRTCATHLPPGSEVYIAFPPSGSHERLARIGRALAGAGFVPVPHIVARSLASFTRFSELLRALQDGGVDRALVVGGDWNEPAGPYRSAEELLRTGAFERMGFKAIGLACYPENHRRIDQAALHAGLERKLGLVTGANMSPWLVSQFCLEPAPIVSMAERLQRGGITAPLRIGLAGPTNRRALWKYALACGVGTSIRALGTDADAVRDLLQREAPDALITHLAGSLANRPDLNVAGIHVFGFGGVPATAEWVRSVRIRAEQAATAEL